VNLVNDAQNLVLFREDSNMTSMWRTIYMLPHLIITVILWDRHYHYPYLTKNGNWAVKIPSSFPQVAQVENDTAKLHTLVRHQGLSSEPLCCCSCWFYQHDFQNCNKSTFICESISSSWRLYMLSNCYPKTTVKDQQGKY
jgi:hypothetical protein